MPRYEYKCRTCGKVTDVICSSAEYIPTQGCTRCGGVAERIYSEDVGFLKLSTPGKAVSDGGGK